MKIILIIMIILLTACSPQNKTNDNSENKTTNNVRGNEIEKFDIEIQKLVPFAPDAKNMIIKITDRKLLDITGGIVQGMSGSPIIQNGKLVGAVTHVFVNDPTRGYGIFIENMLTEAEKIK